MALNSAAAAARSPSLGEALEQIEAADFEGAQSTLEKALADPDLEDADRVEVLRRLGEVRVFLGKPEPAGEAFNRLLMSAPDYQLPDTADPRALELFAAVRAAFMRERRPLALRHAPVEGATAGAPVEVAAELENLPDAHPVLLFWRRAGDAEFSRTELAARPDGAGVRSAAIPALHAGEGEGYDVEYFVEVRDAQGMRVRGVGSRLQPLRFRAVAPPPPPPPWYASPWVWGGALVVAAGAGALGIFFLAGGEEVRLVVKLP